MTNKLNEDLDGNTSSKRVWGGRCIGAGLIISLIIVIMHGFLMLKGKESNIEQLAFLIYAAYSTGGGLLGIGLIERVSRKKE